MHIATNYNEVIDSNGTSSANNSRSVNINNDLVSYAEAAETPPFAPLTSTRSTVLPSPRNSNNRRQLITEGSNNQLNISIPFSPKAGVSSELLYSPKVYHNKTDGFMNDESTSLAIASGNLSNDRQSISSNNSYTFGNASKVCLNILQLPLHDLTTFP